MIKNKAHYDFPVKKSALTILKRRMFLALLWTRRWMIDSWWFPSVSGGGGTVVSVASRSAPARWARSAVSYLHSRFLNYKFIGLLNCLVQKNLCYTFTLVGGYISFCDQEIGNDTVPALRDASFSLPKFITFPVFLSFPLILIIIFQTLTFTLAK